MPELTGSLSSFKLAPLLHFVSDLGKSGDLLLADGHWIGQVSIEHGTVIAAAVENELGESALEFISLALRDGDFEFSEGPPSLRPNFGPGAAPLRRLDQQATTQPSWLASMPGPTAVPRILELPNDAVVPELLVPRSVLYVLMAVDGVQSVRQLARGQGLLRVVSALSTLRQLELVEFDTHELAAPHPRADRARTPLPGPPTASPLPAPLPSAAPGLRDRIGALQRFLLQQPFRLFHSDHLQTLLATAIFVVLVNGQKLEEPYVHFPADYVFPESGAPLVVPDAEYFVLGDNRPESFDSHAGWLVPVDDLIGRAWIRYWPPDVAGIVAPGPVALAQSAGPQPLTSP